MINVRNVSKEWEADSTVTANQNKSATKIMKISAPLKIVTYSCQSGIFSAALQPAELTASLYLEDLSRPANGVNRKSSLSEQSCSSVFRSSQAHQMERSF